MNPLAHVLSRKVRHFPGGLGWSTCCLLLLVLVSGCGLLKEKTYTVSEAEAKFIEFCQKEGKLTPVIRLVGRTEWIYVTLEESIFSLKANNQTDKTNRKLMPFSLLSVDGEFDNQTFLFDYDLVPKVLAPEPLTYGYSYNESYTKKLQLIYQAIQETFFNLADDPKTAATAPNFFVVAVCDISKGIAIKTTFYIQDLKAYLTGAIPFEESHLRELSEVFGDKELIGDKTGKNLNMTEVTWQHFITEQVKNRIKFKFTQSDFPPKTDPDQEIIAILANTLSYYPFKDFNAIYLYNMRDERKMNFSNEQLKTFQESPEWLKDKGKITVIRFPLMQGGIQTTYSTGKDSAPKEEENSNSEKNAP